MITFITLSIFSFSFHLFELNQESWDFIFFVLDYFFDYFSIYIYPNLSASTSLILPQGCNRFSFICLSCKSIIIFRHSISFLFICHVFIPNWLVYIFYKLRRFFFLLSLCFCLFVDDGTECLFLTHFLLFWWRWCVALMIKTLLQYMHFHNFISIGVEVVTPCCFMFWNSRLIES